MSRDIESEIGFLARDFVYQTVKPYSLRFDPDGADDLPRNNHKREKRNVTIKDARPLNPSIDVNGFCITRLSSSLSYEDYEDSSKIENIYVRELADSLKVFFNARHVRIIDYLVRRRDSSYPISDGEEFIHPQPAGLAHLDFSHDEAERMLETLYGDRAGEVLQYRWQVINVWRPLKGPLRDWPLAVCDARTFLAKDDSLASDVVYPEWTYENVMIHYNPRQAWYYFHELGANETMLFKCADSDPDAIGACPHAAFPNPNVVADEPLRESIESRVLVLFGPHQIVPEETGALYGNRR
ncbi:hypothetical protein BDV06DRAFT_225336 [Aspergillus oleicola]